MAAAAGTPPGQTVCANWCYWQFGSKKRDVVAVLEKRDEISLASDFEWTGIDLDAEIEEDDVAISWTA